MVRVVAVLLLGLAVTGCSGGAEPAADPSARTSSRPVVSAPAATSAPSPAPAAPPTPSSSILTVTPPDPVSLPALAQAEHTGGGLRLGAVRERTAAYTSYDVTYASDGLRISGVLDVPDGRGPFPAVVLAHGYIDPAYYVRGQGMTRERGYLAERGYAALHVDYRNHAESTDDPDNDLDLRLGYVADTINAVEALRRTDAVPVADDRIALMGRSMGGGVVFRSLVSRPGLVRAAVAWSAVSSLEGENYDQFQRRDPGTSGTTGDRVVRAHGTPEDAPEFWAGVSARTYLDDVTEPVLIIQGGSDDTCPPRWARATYRAMRDVGVDVRLAWYPDEEHAFGPEFTAAMDRTIEFLRAQGV